MSDLDLLRTLGDQLVPPSLASLREAARRRDRRAQIVSASAAAVAVIAVTATAVVLTPDDDAALRPTGPSQIEETQVRPLTYADGSTIHYGDETVEADGPVVELDVTDAGAGFRTEDGRIWFTDGSSVDEIGAVGEPGPGYGDVVWPMLTRPGWMLSANAGSRLVWFEFPAPGAPEVVVYDTTSGQEVARDPVSFGPGPGHTALPAEVTERFVYWYSAPDPDEEVPGDVAQVRYDPETGDQSPVTQLEVLDDREQDAAVRSVRIKEDGLCDSCPGLHYSDGMNQQMGLNLHVGTSGIDGIAPVGSGDMVVEEVTGEPFRFDRLPGYPDNDGVAWLVQWIDDQTVVILHPREQSTDLIACHLDSDSCEVAVSGPTTIVVPEFGMGVYFG